MAASTNSTITQPTEQGYNYVNSDENTVHEHNSSQSKTSGSPDFEEALQLLIQAGIVKLENGQLVWNKNAWNATDNAEELFAKALLEVIDTLASENYSIAYGRNDPDATLVSMLAFFAEVDPDIAGLDLREQISKILSGSLSLSDQEWMQYFFYRLRKMGYITFDLYNSFGNLLDNIRQYFKLFQTETENTLNGGKFNLEEANQALKVLNDLMTGLQELKDNPDQYSTVHVWLEQYFANGGTLEVPKQEKHVLKHSGWSVVGEKGKWHHNGKYETISSLDDFYKLQKNPGKDTKHWYEEEYRFTTDDLYIKATEKAASMGIDVSRDNVSLEVKSSLKFVIDEFYKARDKAWDGERALDYDTNVFNDNFDYINLHDFLEIDLENGTISPVIKKSDLEKFYKAAENAAKNVSTLTTQKQTEVQQQYTQLLHAQEFLQKQDTTTYRELLKRFADSMVTR